MVAADALFVYLRLFMGAVATSQPVAETDLLWEVTTRLREGLRPVSLYLFGSRAGGVASAESDYDLMAVVADSALPRYERAARARGLLSGIDASFDIIVLTLEEWQRQLKSGVSLANTVADEGVLLYDSRA